MRYLWRGVNHEGEVLKSSATKTLGKAAALSFMKKPMNRPGKARSIVTDGLRSYGVAMKDIGNLERKETGLWRNNRVEKTHPPFRRRERAMNRFRRMKTLQRFASVHAQVHNYFNQGRHLIDRDTYRERRSAALAEWRSVMG